MSSDNIRSVYVKQEPVEPEPVYAHVIVEHTEPEPVRAVVKHVESEKLEND